MNLIVAGLLSQLAPELRKLEDEVLDEARRSLMALIDEIDRRMDTATQAAIRRGLEDQAWAVETYNRTGKWYGRGEAPVRQSPESDGA